MFPGVLSGPTNSVSEEASISSGYRVSCNLNPATQNDQKIKKKRNLPGNPAPDAEVIALSPGTLLATNRFVCEVCNKGFQRDQNLQLHRRGHNLPWKLKQRSSKEQRKRAYICPEPTCVHHHPSRALGDLTGIKKHFCRKHGEKKWKCQKCAKVYAVQSDWKAHAKICGTREYRCDCGTLFSRKDSFITHRAFCDALAEESARLSAAAETNFPANPFTYNMQQVHIPAPVPAPPAGPLIFSQNQVQIKQEAFHVPFSASLYQDRAIMDPTLHFSAAGQPSLSATALLQKAASMGHSVAVGSTMANLDMQRTAVWRKSDDGFTRDFLGLAAEPCGGSSGGGNMMRELMPFTGDVHLPPYDRDRSFVKYAGVGYGETCQRTWENC